MRWLLLLLLFRGLPVSTHCGALALLFGLRADTDARNSTSSGSFTPARWHHPLPQVRYNYYRDITSGQLIAFAPRFRPQASRKPKRPRSSTLSLLYLGRLWQQLPRLSGGTTSSRTTDASGISIHHPSLTLLILFFPEA